MHMYSVVTVSNATLIPLVVHSYVNLLACLANVNDIMQLKYGIILNADHEAA